MPSVPGIVESLRTFYLCAWIEIYVLVKKLLKNKIKEKKWKKKE